MSEYVVPPWTTLDEQREAGRYEELVGDLAASAGSRMVVVYCSDCSTKGKRDRVVAEVRASSAGPLFMARTELGNLASMTLADKNMAGKRVQAPWSELNILLDVAADRRPQRPNSTPTTATAACPKHGTFDLDEMKLMQEVARYQAKGTLARVPAQRLCVVLK